MKPEAREQNPDLRSHFLKAFVPIDETMSLRERMRRDRVRDTLGKFLGPDMDINQMLGSFKQALASDCSNRGLMQTRRYLRDREREKHLASIEAKLAANAGAGEATPLMQRRLDRLEQERDSLKRVLSEN